MAACVSSLWRRNRKYAKPTSPQRPNLIMDASSGCLTRNGRGDSTTRATQIPSFDPLMNPPPPAKAAVGSAPVDELCNPPRAPMEREPGQPPIQESGSPE